MKTLYLLRHAKSSWKDPTLADFDRPLNNRGKRASERIGRFLGKEDIILDLVLSSNATRARETIEIVYQTAKLHSELRYDERIYEAGPLRLFEVLSGVEDDRDTVLMVGHNPGLEELLHILTGSTEHMPTAALARIELSSSKWSEIATTKGNLASFIKPKLLKKS